MVKVHQIQAADHRGRYGNKFGQRYTSRDCCNAFPQKNDSVINVKVEFGEGEGKVPLDNIAKRAEAYKPKERVTIR